MIEESFANLPTSHVRTLVFFLSPQGIRVLLVRRRFPPFDSKLALPGGFLKSGVDPKKRAIEKVLKETGLDISSEMIYPLARRHKFSRDPREEVVSENFACFIYGDNPDDLEHLDSQDNYEWYYLDEIEELAFDHGAILCEGLSFFFNWMPSVHSHHHPEDYQKIQKLIKSQSVDLEFFGSKELDLKKPIAFFGGSFNPWHEGHNACLELCPNKNIMIVADSNPWKSAQLQGCYWREYREIVIRYKDSPFVFFPGFYGMIEGNPTVDWLPKVLCMEKELLVGEDTFINILKWKNVEKLTKDVSAIYVTPRNVGTKVKTNLDEVSNSLRGFNPDIKIKILEDHKYKDLSSSQIRGEK